MLGQDFLCAAGSLALFPGYSWSSHVPYQPCLNSDRSPWQKVKSRRSERETQSCIATTQQVARPGVGILGRKGTEEEETDPTSSSFIPNFCCSWGWSTLGTRVSIQSTALSFSFGLIWSECIKGHCTTLHGVSPLNNNKTAATICWVPLPFQAPFKILFIHYLPWIHTGSLQGLEPPFCKWGEFKLPWPLSHE